MSHGLKEDLAESKWYSFGVIKKATTNTKQSGQFLKITWIVYTGEESEYCSI